MARDIGDWLEALALGKYAAIFNEHEIRLDDIAELTDADLKEMGLPIGPRRRLLKAIRQGFGEGAKRETARNRDEGPQLRPAIEGERRQLTVMFCDLVGSTDLSRRLDPEDFRELIRRYQDIVVGVVVRFDGYVANFLGDGILAYFGWPRGHEDQAERAVLAGLRTLDAMKGLTAGDGAPVRSRVGIATGEVVIGDLVGKAAAQRDAVLGETPSLASRLQEVADADQVVIDEMTRRLIAHVFDLVDLGRRQIKGFPKPVRSWRVLREAAAESRFEATRPGAAPRIVGRGVELRRLRQCWRDAKRRQGRFVLLSGEAGIGKSLLVQAIAGEVTAEEHFRLRYQCSPHRTSSAFYPVIQRIERAARFADDDSEATKLDKLEALLRLSGTDIRRTAPLFAALLSLPGTSRYGVSELSAPQRREQTIEVLVGEILALSRRRPVLLVLEDAHWIDPSTEDLISRVIDRIDDAAVLVLITHRPDYAPEWAEGAGAVRLALERLGPAESGDIVRAIAGGAIDDELVDRLVARADGVPLYLEELTKSVVEAHRSSGDKAADGHIPETLHASLMARLDRLGEAKQLVQTGAAIGRAFGHDLLLAVSSEPSGDVAAGLDRLLESDLVSRRGTGRGATYLFKHTLVQDVAYQSMLRDKRRALHRRIAETIEARWPDLSANEPETLARHYTEAGLAEAAIANWLRAGEKAYNASAIVETVNYLNKGLAVLEGMPQEERPLKLELRLQSTLGSALKDLKAYGHADVERAYKRALEICRRIGGGVELFPVLLGLCIYYVVRGNLNEARALGEQLMAIAQQGEDSVLHVQANYALGVASFPLGDFASARGQLEKGVALYRPESHSKHVALFGQDAGAICRCRLALTLWYLGYPDQAKERSREAMALARRHRHPFTLAYVLSWTDFLHNHLGDPVATENGAKETVSLAGEYGFPYWLAWGHFFQGWAEWKRRRRRDSLVAMGNALEELQAIGTKLAYPYLLGLMAEVYGDLDQTSEAMRLLDEALAAVEAQDQHWPEADLYRIRGDLLVRSAGPPDKAEQDFRTALEKARSRDARSIELRAATGLARHLHGQGETAAAREVLRPVLGWFTEGADTPDLNVARALLAEMNSRG